MTRTLTLDVRDDGVAVVWIDVPGAPVNTMREDFPGELDDVLDHVAADAAIRGVVFASAKPDGFLAGADLKMIRELDDGAALQALSRQAQAATSRVAALELPTGCAIHGACLGAGLELAIACDVRVASDDRTTRLGLPEVELGLVPGAGGTQRLPRLIALPDALELMLTGKRIAAHRARELGLVDEVVPAPIAVDVACERVRALGDAGEQRTRGIRRLERLVTEANPVSRRIIVHRARDRAEQAARGNYPAPLRILDVVEIGLDGGMEAGLRAESTAFGELATSPVSRELVRLFFLRRELEHEPRVPEGIHARAVRRVGIVGAGTMGSGIAYATARAGLPVRLHDVSDEAVARGLRAVRALADRDLARGRLTSLERDRLMHGVGVTTEYRGFHACELVIEAVVEDLEVKRGVIEELERHTPAHAHVIVASNTSSLPIARLATASRHPEAVIGMHYFSPVHKMPLLEIAVTDRTAPEVLATCVALGRRQGKLVIVVNDGPGFYTTRILAAYLHEACRLLERGVSIEAIDGALVDHGFPIGPFAAVDSVGIDVARDIGDVLGAELGDRLEPPPIAAAMVADGRLGAKNERGFYRYRDGRRDEVDHHVYRLLDVRPDDHAMPRETIAWRCALRMVDEAFRCFADGVLMSTSDGDAGAVFGLGFPPFRGGPFRLVAQLGAAAVVDIMRSVELQPSPMLARMASTGATASDARDEVAAHG